MTVGTLFVFRSPHWKSLATSDFLYCRQNSYSIELQQKKLSEVIGLAGKVSESFILAVH